MKAEIQKPFELSPMTDHQRTMLEAAGWQVVESGFWRSPLTGRAMDERSALAILSIKPRAGQPRLYTTRLTGRNSNRKFTANP